MSEDYSNERTRVYTLKLRALLEDLPPICAEFFRGIEPSTSVLTRYGYALDLKLFFKFLISDSLCSRLLSIRDIDCSILENVSIDHIERYLEYVAMYPAETDSEDYEKEEYITNGERAKARKLSSVRSFFKYLYKKGRITRNVAALADTPKVHEKPIVKLEPDEIDALLTVVESGEGLSPAQKKYHKQTQVRDTAIVTLFLGTGMRISELVGINIDDLNFMSNEVRIVRKGGNQDVLVFGSEVREALLNYMLRRENMTAQPGHEKALFLSMQNKRMTVRAIENLVKKYAALAAPLKRISPHKLRSTYGTMLYRESGDIYLVADVLGQKDVNTTRKHYVPQAEDRRRFAAEVISLKGKKSGTADADTKNGNEPDETE
ncbi:putative uncharacterized protein [Clostridium sp. CAG:138]|nr:putative uncharacterized protein [Clostridium sp. CAG:138]